MVTEIKNQNWFRRHWLISIFLGLIVLGMIGSIFDTGNNSEITGNVVNEQVQEEGETCIPSWVCSSWSECSASGIQKRTCTDSNNCRATSGKPPETQTCAAPKNYLKNSYDDTCKIFDYDSKYTDIQKEKIFEEDYKGKYVQWTGTISDIDFSIIDNLRLEVMMSCGTGRIYMNSDEYEKLILLNKGDKVTFLGRFDTEPTFKIFGGIHFVLKDGELV